ncbi:hypothetical protein A3Q56_04753 [Intoshia linei]|uniref:Malate dehydrogenase, cytoplasmic n=1 Tax=Intoshia linei TaxID=1819745 RepID=A0A177B270_9BILA|nr:hypothetical protein A3Q56_04753 [Intoshia linei]
MAGEQIKRRLREYEKEPYRIVITGATSQIAQTLIVCMGSGYFLGLNRPIILNLFDVATIESCLIASKMELEDCAFDNIIEINCTVDEQVAFIDADLIVMIGCVSRREGMERSELLGTNVIIFAEQAININKFAKPTCKILVTGNPANTNAFIVKQYAPNILPENITCLARLDQNRAMAQELSVDYVISDNLSHTNQRKLRRIDFLVIKKSMEEEVFKMAIMDNLSFNRIAKSDFNQMSFKKRNSEYDNTAPTWHNFEELKIMLQDKCDKEMRFSITMDECIHAE